MTPVPRLLLASEANFLRAGVAQRARTIRTFLEDHYSGEKRYTQLLSAANVDRLIDRWGETNYQGYVDPTRITFWYGPDLARLPTGKFLVLEDNLGFLGGPEDLLTTRRALFDLVPGYERLLQPLDNPMQHFHDLVDQARRLSRPPEGKVVYLSLFRDASFGRVADVLASLGVEAVAPHTTEGLVCDGEGVWFARTRSAPRERVGFVIFHAEHRWMDDSHPATAGALSLETLARVGDRLGALEPSKRSRIEALRRRDSQTGKIDFDQLSAAVHDAFPGFLTSSPRTLPRFIENVAEGRVGTNYSPGIDFVTDKSFKGAIDRLTTFYFGEHPLLRSTLPESFIRLDEAGREVADPEAIEEKLGGGRYREYVFKPPEGRAGKGIELGPKLSDGQAAQLRERIERDPGAFIAERYVRMSTHDGNLVDLRAFVAVGPGEERVSPTFWGRASPIGGSGLVNISRGGHATAVLVVADAAPPKLSARQEVPRARL